MTPAGFIPANRARSTEPSVCPVRTRTPPLCAFSGKTWPGETKSSGCDRSINGRQDGRCPVGRRNACRDPSSRIDRYGEGGLKQGRIVRDHHGEAEFVEPLLCQGEADQTPPVFGHEVDGLWRSPSPRPWSDRPRSPGLHHRPGSPSSLHGCLPMPPQFDSSFSFLTPLNNHVPSENHDPTSLRFSPLRSRSFSTYFPTISASRFT